MSAIYVNAAWSGKNDGDSVTVGGKTYTIGTDAFASVAKAISSVADLDGKTIAFADDSSVTPAAPFTTTYVTIDTRYATAGNIDGKTVTFTGNSNVSEVLWFDLNYKLPEADAPETVLKFENAYVYMTKIRPDYNSSVIISGSTLDYSQGGQNGNIYAANTGVVTIQNNSKVLSLAQLSAYGEVNVDQSELHACSANGVKGSLNVTNGSTFTLSGIAIGDGGSVTIDNSTMVRKAVLTAFDDGNQSVLDWTANRELPRYRVNIGAYQGSKLTGTGTMTVKNGAIFDFSSAFAAAEYKDVDGANTSAAFVTVSDGSKLVIDGRDDAGKNNKVTFNVDQLINLGDVDVSGAVLLKIGSLDGRMTVNNTTFTDGTVIGDAAAPAGCIDLIGDEINFEGTVTLNSAVNAFTTDSEGKHYSTNINIAKDAVITWNTKQYNDGTWSGGFNCGSSDVLNVEGSLTITGDNVYLKAEALVAGTGKLHINDAGFQNTYGKLTVKGEMVITDRTGAYQNIKLAGNDNAATTGELDVDGGKLTIDGPSFAFGGGYNSTGWIDVTESSVLIQNGGTITANSTIFRNGKNNTLKLDNGTFQFTASPDFGTVHDTLGYGIFNNGAIEAVNGSTLDFSTTRSMGNSATIRIEDSVFSANEMQNSGTLAIYGTSDVTINTYVGPVAEGSPEAIMTINGVEAQVAIGDIYYAGITCEITSDQLSAVRAGESRTLLTVTGSGNAPAMSFTVDGAALTANADGTFSSGDYVFKFEALGDDGIANDLVLTNTAPPITLSAGSTDLGGFETIAAAVAAMNADTANTAPYTITLHGTTTETQTTTLYFEKDLIISGVGTITASPQWFIGNADDANGVKVATNLTLTDGADLKILYGVSDANLQGRHDRGGDAGKASTLTLNNARISGPKDMKWQGAITITGSGNKDADGNVIYGFKGADDTDYTANLSAGQHFASQSRYPQMQGNIGLDMSNGAWLNIAGDYTMAEDEASVYNISDSKLVVGQEVDLQKSGNVFNISGQSVVMVNNLGFTDACTNISAGSATINVTGMDSEITFGQISSAVTAINFTLTSAEIFSAGMIEAGDDVELLTLNNADAALDAATVLSITLDGAAYTLGDEIVDDAGNKYVINMGDANGDSAANDLLVTMTEKAPEPVIPEEPGEGGEGSEGGMEIAAQNPPVFINPKYSEKSTGKKVNGVELEYGINAFSSIEDAKAALGADAAVSMVVSKSAKFDSESDLSGISEIAGNSPVEKIRKTSATIKSTPKKSLTLNGTTAAATGFRQFAKVKVLNGANIGGDIINEKYTVKFKGTLDANGEWQDGVATTTNAAAGTLKATDSTIANAFGFKSVKLTNSQAGILGVNPVAKDVATIKGGAVASSEIVKEKRVGSVTAKDSIVDSVMDYKTLKLQGESAVASIVNVQNVTVSGKADVQINDLTDTAILNNKLTIGSKAIVDLGIGNFGAGNDKMIIGSKATVYADSLDFGEGKDSLKISGTLVLENGMLEGIEKISGRGEIATTAAYADALDERFDDIFGGEILDLGNTVANFRGTKNELADNTEKKALKWNSAEGELGGWLGIGDDVDCIDSVDFVKITASKDGTLEISSADWSGSSDIVTLDGVKLDISGGSASFGITAGEDYLLKVERKDSNSMSYDIKLA